MSTDVMIPASEFCIHHHIELSFIDSLQEAGLIQIIRNEQTTLLPLDELPQIEKMVRLYYELNINLEGVETITYLLQRMNSMQQEIVLLKNKLSLFETA